MELDQMSVSMTTLFLCPCYVSEEQGVVSLNIITTANDILKEFMVRNTTSTWLSSACIIADVPKFTA